MFLTRVLTVAIALPTFTAALLLLPPLAWTLFLLPGLFVAGWEWGGLAGYRTAVRWSFAALVAVSAFALTYLTPSVSGTLVPVDVGAYAVSCMFWMAVAPVWLRVRWQTRNALLLGVTGWIALVPMWLALVRLQADAWALLLFLSIVWIADTAAYFAGKGWGRRKLAPDVSPGKSWEGVIGAAAVLSIYYLALWFIVPPTDRYFHFWAGAGLFAVLFALSIEGDLFESWLKRQAGKKDSGNLLPGHGGVLDRIDGLSATLPTAALVFYFY